MNRALGIATYGYIIDEQTITEPLSIVLTQDETFNVTITEDNLTTNVED